MGDVENYEKIHSIHSSEPTRIYDTPSSNRKYSLVIHGGAGTINRESVTPELREKYKRALEVALKAGYAVLERGGEAMDAAVAAVTAMEDCPMFNAGKGAVFNTDGKNELEASIMMSRPPKSHPHIPQTRKGLGVTLLTHARNPCQVARALFLAPAQCPHVTMSGAQAESLASGMGEEMVDPSYFYTENRWREHRKGLGLPEEPLPYPKNGHVDTIDPQPKGTVGAVALDVRGCIAAVTSTGGRTNKLPGRIGDTPLMGSGYWAEEWPTGPMGKWRRLIDRLLHRSHPKFNAVGVSGTGEGDYFIRSNTSASLVNRMKFLGESVETAALTAINKLGANGGTGGIIALDYQGNYALPMNTDGMYRGIIRDDGLPRTAIFHDDILN